MTVFRMTLSVCLLTFALQAPVQAYEKMTIEFDVTSNGLVSTSVPMGEKAMRLPRGARVKLVFRYADANRNAHQFSLVSIKAEMVSGRLAADGAKTASLEFTVGERGEDFYRLSCELPCIAMERLTDYVIYVEKQAS